MKIRRAIYIILGSLFILVNILVDIINPDNSPMVTQGNAFSFGYFIGSHFLIIFGLVFLGLAYRVNKKIKRKQNNELEKNINEIGKM
jgi:hypothetical protein